MCLRILKTSIDSSNVNTTIINTAIPIQKVQLKRLNITNHIGMLVKNSIGTATKEAIKTRIKLR